MVSIESVSISYIISNRLTPRGGVCRGPWVPLYLIFIGIHMYSLVPIHCHSIPIPIPIHFHSDSIGPHIDFIGPHTYMCFHVPPAMFKLGRRPNLNMSEKWQKILYRNCYVIWVLSPILAHFFGPHILIKDLYCAIQILV